MELAKNIHHNMLTSIIVINEVKVIQGHIHVPNFMDI